MSQDNVWSLFKLHRAKKENQTERTEQHNGNQQALNLRDIKERTRHDKDLKKHTARVASSADENATNPDPLLCP